MIDTKIMWKIITITAVTLALAILITAVGGVVLLVGSFADKEPPVITPVNGNVVTIKRGDTFSYRSQVKCTDNSGEECTLEWISFDQNVAGTHTVKYRATDPSGNVGYFNLTVKVEEVNVENNALMALVESLAKSKLGYDRAQAKAYGYSKEKIVRDIFNFVADPTENTPSNANIVFIDSKSNCQNQAGQNGNSKRTGWKTDWEEEAYLTLNGKMQGDCYTFYSVSKAFFEYFEIPNVGIQRTTESPMTKAAEEKYGAGKGGTHYWNIVKIESGWYYYDSTRYAGHFTKCSEPCLVTEAQLLSYVTGKGVSDSGYYWIEKTNSVFFDADDNNGVYPKVETKEITK